MKFTAMLLSVCGANSVQPPHTASGSELAHSTEQQSGCGRWCVCVWGGGGGAMVPGHHVVHTDPTL